MGSLLVLARSPHEGTLGGIYTLYYGGAPPAVRSGTDGRAALGPGLGSPAIGF